VQELRPIPVAYLVLPGQFRLVVTQALVVTLANREQQAERPILVRQELLGMEGQSLLPAAPLQSEAQSAATMVLNSPAKQPTFQVLPMQDKVSIMWEKTPRLLI
jgi:hypothetical protein